MEDQSRERRRDNVLQMTTEMQLLYQLELLGPVH
jgi:hypothetical protein